VTAGTQVTLDASGSSDPDGDVLTYQWRWVSGPSSVSVGNSTSVQATVTLPGKGSDVFEVGVSDGRATITAQVTVSVGNRPPVAEAGAAQSVQTNQQVMLDASGSSDPDGDGLRYQWKLVSGPVLVSLANAGSVRANCTLTVAGAYIFEVAVADGTTTSTDRVTITVTAPPQQVSQSILVILDLSGSMNDPVPGGTQKKIDAAKAALQQVLTVAPSDGSKEYGLMVFGQQSCDDVRVVVEFTTNPQAVIAQAEAMSVGDGTPLAAAIRKGSEYAAMAAHSDDVQLVLLSDGKEECGGNPEEEAGRISGKRVSSEAIAAQPVARQIRLNVIGFGLTPWSRR